MAGELQTEVIPEADRRDQELLLCEVCEESFLCQRNCSRVLDWFEAKLKVGCERGFE